MWSRFPKVDERGLRAGNRWLRNLEPTKEAKRRVQLARCKRTIEAALASDTQLLRMFRTAVQTAHLLGRTSGLREGVDLYDYGLRIQDGKTEAYQSVMKYTINNRDNPEKLVVKEICIYLDKQLRRIKNNQNTAKCRIAPPDDWGCATWLDAFKKKRNDVDVLFSDAKSEAQSEQFALLMAMATWREKERRTADPSAYATLQDDQQRPAILPRARDQATTI